jgi:hypothetical protein
MRQANKAIITKFKTTPEFVKKGMAATIQTNSAMLKKSLRTCVMKSTSCLGSKKTFWP